MSSNRYDARCPPPESQSSAKWRLRAPVYCQSRFPAAPADLSASPQTPRALPLCVPLQPHQPHQPVPVLPVPLLSLEAPGFPPPSFLLQVKQIVPEWPILEMKDLIGRKSRPPMCFPTLIKRFDRLSENLVECLLPWDPSS